ncbi:hypothetical protein F4678DRAFT_437737 [Xylaria arbuscula]|nr:hypothetical protein F4678DRAFT_437737 [Xylaria arbuscula]
MSLLPRWSLPNRGFTRDKSQDNEEQHDADESKYLTIHISHLGPRRRPNLSTVFSTLFEKHENRPSIRNADGRSEDAGDDLPLLASRRDENVRPDTDLRYSHDHGCRDIVEAPVEVRQCGAFGSISKNATIEPLPQSTPGVFDQFTEEIEEKPKIRTFSLSSTATYETETRDGFPSPLPPAKSAETTTVVDRERNGSASSSYPSEGIRSPVQGCSSPEPTTNTRTANYFTEYRRFSRYPSHSSWHLSDVRVNESLHTDAAGDSSLVIDDASLDCTIADRSYNHTPPSPASNLPADRRPDLACTDMNHPLRRSSTHVVKEKQQKPSSNSEITVPILENEDAVTSQLEVSFMAYKRPNVRSTSDGTRTSGCHCQLEGNRKASSTDPLDPNVDTTGGQTVTIPIRQRPSTTDEDGAWSTIHEPKERPSSSSTPWMHLLASTSSNGSSHTLTQRLQRLKLRLWAKRVCFKTKARFELVGKPVSTTASFTSPKTRRREWRHKMRKNARKRMDKVRRSFKTKKLKSEKRWNVGDTLSITSKKRGTTQHRGMADHFFNTLAKRKSLQFALFRSEKGDKILDTHKRVRSCPADVGC